MIRICSEKGELCIGTFGLGALPEDGDVWRVILAPSGAATCLDIEILENYFKAIFKICLCSLFNRALAIHLYLIISS